LARRGRGQRGKDGIRDRCFRAILLHDGGSSFCSQPNDDIGRRTTVNFQRSEGQPRTSCRGDQITKTKCGRPGRCPGVRVSPKRTLCRVDRSAPRGGPRRHKLRLASADRSAPYLLPRKAISIVRLSVFAGLLENTVRVEAESHENPPIISLIECPLPKCWCTCIPRDVGNLVKPLAPR